MAQSVPVVGDGEPAGFLGECFLALQGLELVFFGDLGGDHLEDVVREPAERDRVVLGGAPDQVGFGVAAVLDRERLDTLDDHGRLLFGHTTGGHRVPDRFVVAVERFASSRRRSLSGRVVLATRRRRGCGMPTLGTDARVGSPNEAG